MHIYLGFVTHGIRGAMEAGIVRPAGADRPAGGGVIRVGGWAVRAGGGQAGVLSQAAARAEEARASQASWMTSASSVRVSSAIRLARIRTDGWPSKCGGVKNGEPWSWTRACLSASDVTQNMMTSGYRSPVPESTASGRGLRKNTKDLAPTW